MALVEEIDTNGRLCRHKMLNAAERWLVGAFRNDNDSLLLPFVPQDINIINNIENFSITHVTIGA